MRSRLGAIALVLGISVIVSTLTMYAHDKEDRVAGTVQLINKDTKTILVSGEANSKQMQVAYDEKTKITMDNKAATLDDIQKRTARDLHGTQQQGGSAARRALRRAPRQLTARLLPLDKTSCLVRRGAGHSSLSLHHAPASFHHLQVPAE